MLRCVLGSCPMYDARSQSALALDSARRGRPPHIHGAMNTAPDPLCWPSASSSNRGEQDRLQGVASPFEVFGVDDGGGELDKPDLTIQRTGHPRQVFNQVHSSTNLGLRGVFVALLRLVGAT